MKNTFIITFIVCILLSSVTVFAAQFMEVTAYELNIRNGAGKSYKVVTKVNQGEKLELLKADPVDGWYKVKTESGVVGFASQNYLKKVEGSDKINKANPFIEWFKENLGIWMILPAFFLLMFLFMIFGPIIEAIKDAISSKISFGGSTYSSSNKTNSYTPQASHSSSVSGRVLENSLYYDIRTGERLKVDTNTGEYINSQGEVVSIAYTE